MAYTKKEWQSEEIITAVALNNIEDGIEAIDEALASKANVEDILEIGTTATTAKAGNYQPTWAQVTGKPLTFAPEIGSTATTAKAGNYVPTWSEVSGKPATFPPTIGATAATAAAGNHDHAVTAHVDSGLEAAANIQALAQALSARIKALEDAVVE